MSKQLIFDEAARYKILSGVKLLSKAVKATLGPKGRNVVIDKKYGSPLVTKDGVTVAKEISLADPYENMGAQMVKEAASQTNDKAGDGTTTATILAEAIYTEGLKNVMAGSNPVYLKRGIDKAVKTVVAQLKEISQPISNFEQIKQIATVSANWDEEVGSIIAEAMQKVGQNGVVSIEESGGVELSLNLVEGLEFDRGYLSPFFCTNAEEMEVLLEDAYVFIYEKRITNLQQILPLLQKVVQTKKPLLIIADDFDSDVIGALVVNKMRGGFNVCAVKSPGFGERKKEILGDISVITGAKFISEDSGFKLEEITLADLGQVKKIIVNKDKTTLIEGQSSPSEIKGRITQIKNALEKSTSEYEKEKLRERLGKLSGGVAIVNVGGPSEIEMKEKKARVEDALHATRAALQEGILPGGGTAFLMCLAKLAELQLDGDEKIGADIVYRAIQYPVKTLCANAGVSGEVVIAQVLKSEWNIGYNVSTGKYEKMVDNGIIDPMKVTRTALENAASVAGLMLTVECMITDVPEIKAEGKPNAQ